MRRIVLFTILACSLLLNTASAQTSTPNCPITHPAQTGLDHASMLAAYKASFKGIYGRESTMQAGAGVDDGEYWITVSDHYGEFSDGVCRAGWSRYWEVKLTGTDSANPSLGDQPALYQPGGTVTPTPTPTPTPPVDLGPLEQRISALEATIANHEQRIGTLEKQLSDLRSVVVGLGDRYDLLAARQQTMSCSASVFGVPIHCALK